MEKKKQWRGRGNGEREERDAKKEGESWRRVLMSFRREVFASLGWICSL